MFSNLKAGLDKGCSALYLASGENIEQVQFEIENFGLKIDDPIKMKIVTSRHFYTPDGEFKADRVVERYRSLIDESVDKGFEGLYVSADVADTFDYLTKNLMAEVWLKYENAWRRTFKFPMEAICAYHIDQIESKGQILLQLIQAHKNTITSRTAKFLDNKKLYLDAITEKINGIFSEEAVNIIFRFVERCFRIPRNQIPNKIEDFNKALESLLGEGATIILKQEILNNLRGRIELE